MKKTFRMEDLDCAVCAAKMEKEIRRIDGVTNVSISFLTQKMTLEAEDDRFDEIARLAAKACRRIDDECKVILK